LDRFFFRHLGTSYWDQAKLSTSAGLDRRFIPLSTALGFRDRRIGKDGCCFRPGVVARTFTPLL
jgi:hypothetical protein